MKLLATLALGLFGLVIVIGGLGAVAEDTFPAQVPLHNAANPVTTAGDPTLLILCVVGAVVFFAIGFNRGR
jgi:hypothetical protein